MKEENKKQEIEVEEGNDAFSDSQSVSNETEQACDPEVEEETAESLLEKAKTEIAELKDKNLRQMAEFDNYRKRVLKEKADLILNGGEKVLTEILPIIDDLERAEQGMEHMTEVNAVKEGVELIIEKFMKFMKSQGVEPIDTKDKDFDVNYHEAITMIPAPAPEMKGKVIDCISKGYTLNEKVIRYAKVVVGE
ncbi:MAG: nucleotide exchange factor GrpE [Bacteroidaceae bacterium]|nr:nucleotide exchange factor GrpE [Bacteroidaceae bacterium]MDO4801067.1 nucleotide exchange factor GrpE [Prevotellaceae bacterium]